MGPAAEADVVHGRLAAAGVLLLVIELQVATHFAASPGLAHVSALALVAPAHGPPHVRGDMPGVRAGTVLAATRPGARGEPLAFDLLDHLLNGPGVDLRDVATPHLVAEQVLQVAEALVLLAAPMELHGIGFRR